MSDRDDRYEAREKLRRSVDELAGRVNLYTQMQKDPLKMIGGASGVGALLGVLVGSRFKRTKRVYVDANSSAKEQKAFAKAQHKAGKGGGGGGLTGGLVAAATTVGLRLLQDRYLKPQLDRLADNLTQRAQQPHGGSEGQRDDPKRPM